jgi:hypothetical protein
MACMGLNISNAEWRTNGNGQLRVSVVGVRDGSFVLSNAYSVGGSPQVIATASGRNGKANFNVNGKALNPVPCSVQVDQPEAGLCGQADVINPPADCGPQAPQGVGSEPIARSDVYGTALLTPRSR